MSTTVAPLPASWGWVVELRDGFIVSIFNYCDRWCERCVLTAHCRLFADIEGVHERSDKRMRPPVLPDVDAGLQSRSGERVSAAALLLSASTRLGMEVESDAEWRPRLPPEHKAIYERTLAYGVWALEWLPERFGANCHRPAHPAGVICWFASLPGKVYRSLTGLAEDDGDREFPADHEGDAKVAILGLEESANCWRGLLDAKQVDEATALPCIAEITWLRARLEVAMPNARAFIRPGFDEPQEVTQLRQGVSKVPKVPKVPQVL